MTPLRIVVIASIFTSSTFSLAANLPRNVNVIVCQPNAGCIHHSIFGHDYKIISTDRFTVMVFLSNEGPYTRADISITNLTPNSINLSPEDFRIEALNSKSKVFLYVPPSQLENVPTLTRTTAARRRRAGEPAKSAAQRTGGRSAKSDPGSSRTRGSDPASEGNHRPAQPGGPRSRLLRARSECHVPAGQRRPTHRRHCIQVPRRHQTLTHRPALFDCGSRSSAR